MAHRQTHRRHVEPMCGLACATYGQVCVAPQVPSAMKTEGCLSVGPAKTDLLYEHSSALLLGQMTCSSLPIF